MNIQEIRKAVNAKTVYLSHARLFGADVLVILDRCWLPPSNYPNDGQGLLITLPGEFSYFREISEALEAMARHGLTTTAGSDLVAIEVQP